MKTKSFSDMQCSIARTLELVGSWWSLLIIRDAMMGARRFKHFEASLGIAKNTLTKRLAELIESGILETAAGQNGSAYDEYQLTKKGRDLAPVLIALAQWGDKWAVHPKGPSFEFIDVATGDDLSAVVPRRADGEALAPGDIGIRRTRANLQNPSVQTERT